MSYLKKQIVDQIHDLESPLNARMTFEEVMQRREKKKRRLLLFWPRIVVVGGLFTAAGLGYFAWSSSHGKVKQSIVIAENQKGLAQKSNVKEQPEVKDVNADNDSYAKNDYSAKPVADAEPASKQSFEKLVKQSAETNSAIFSQKSLEKSIILAEITAVENREILETAIEIPKSMVEVPVTIEKANLSIVETPISIVETPITKVESPLPEVEIPQTTDETIAGIILEKQNESNRWLDIEALLALTHGKGLQMFEIPDPLSKSDFEVVFVDLEEDELNRYFRPGNFESPYHLELSVGTGSRVLTNFDETLPLSVLGNQYNAHYQLSLLKDMSNGIQLAVGMSYGEWEGNGQWQKREWNSYTVRDSSVLIGFPNPNDRQVIYFDSTVNELTTTQGGIKYQITKISIPIGFRKLMYLGKTPFRVAMQISPGKTIKSSGYYFSDFEFHSIENQRLTTMDMKVALGPSISINRNFTVVLEPNANMQMFHDSRTNRIHSKSFYGFGFSLIRHFN